MNAAQQIYKQLGLDITVVNSRGKSKSATKFGPGRVHKDGYPSFKKRQRIAQFLEMKARLEAATKLKMEQSAVTA